MSLAGKTLFITGASRGIGLAIALRAAGEGANVAIVAKTATPHPRLPGTIYTAARDVEAAGGRALPLQCDIRFEDQVIAAVNATIETFGGIDACVNNASAIALTATVDTDMKRYDLMNQINARGTFVCSKATIPALAKSHNPHILNMSPPLDMKTRWFSHHVAYTMAKFGMSMCTLGMSEELKSQRIAVNSLWPLTTIDTAAVRNVLGGDSMAKVSRTADIVADAAVNILNRDAGTCTGNFFIDEEVLREAGVTDFAKYAIDPESPLMPDFFVPDDVIARSSTPLQRLPY
ncbi:MAG: NAD(P)-dependent oxidoreductase [Candidatus Baltobacteraceae bacterium]